MRYCAQLEEEVGCDALTVACKQLDNIVTRTNNAVHLSLIEGFDEPMVEFGSLLYQVLHLNIVTLLWYCCMNVLYTTVLRFKYSNTHVTWCVILLNIVTPVYMTMFCHIGNISIIRAYLASTRERETSVPVWNGHFVMQTARVEFRQDQIRLQAKTNGMITLYTV